MVSEMWTDSLRQRLVGELVAEQCHTSHPSHAGTILGLETGDNGSSTTGPKALSTFLRSVNQGIRARVLSRVRGEALSRCSQNGDQQRIISERVRNTGEPHRRGACCQQRVRSDLNRDDGCRRVTFGEVGDERRIGSRENKGELGREGCKRCGLRTHSDQEVGLLREESHQGLRCNIGRVCWTRKLSNGKPNSVCLQTF